MKEKKAINVKLYTEQEFLNKLKEFHEHFIAEETQDDETSSAVVLVDMLAGVKFIGAIEKAMENGDF